MRAWETKNAEPQPQWCGVEIAALRPHPERVAAELRRELPGVLAGIVGEVDDAQLELTLLADAHGMVAVEVAVTADERAAEIAAEIAYALAAVADTTLRNRPVQAVSEWAVVTDNRSGPVGFISEAVPNGEVSVHWRARADHPSEQLIESLAGMPGHGLRVRLRSAGLAQRRWEAQLHAVTTGAAPSLRFRSAVRNRFDGFKVDWSHHAPATWIQVEAAQLPNVFTLPVGGPAPLAGAHMAPPAPITSAPPRHAVADHEALRVGVAITGGGRPFPVELSLTERLRHLHVLGRTGTGKSSALAGMVNILAARGEGALVADPHGHLCDRVLAELPSSAKDRVWVIRCGDIDNPVPINPSQSRTRCVAVSRSPKCAPPPVPVRQDANRDRRAQVSRTRRNDAACPERCARYARLTARCAGGIQRRRLHDRRSHLVPRRSPQDLVAHEPHGEAIRRVRPSHRVGQQQVPSVL